MYVTFAAVFVNVQYCCLFSVFECILCNVMFVCCGWEEKGVGGGYSRQTDWQMGFTLVAPYTGSRIVLCSHSLRKLRPSHKQGNKVILFKA